MANRLLQSRKGPLATRRISTGLRSCKVWFTSAVPGPQTDAERELNICQLAELRCRQMGWQSVERVWKYFVLDLTGDFPWMEEEDKPSLFPPGYRPLPSDCLEDRLAGAMEVGLT